MPSPKPYQQVPIVDCGEPLVPIPIEQFALEQPHPYLSVGAPYGDRSPYYLRQGVVAALLQAQASLQQARPHWRIQIFDAYRPIAVQHYMVNHTFAQVVRQQNRSPDSLSAEDAEQIWQQVYQFWAVPSRDPAMPPPHSTGAAVDVTLVDESGQPIDMGSAIDELSPRSYPDHYAAAIGREAAFHQHRQQLQQAMASAGFRQHPREWWHFSLGDQLWAWLSADPPHPPPIARYGGI